MTTIHPTSDNYPYSFADATEVPRQARIVDISRYWRTGGIDWPRLEKNFDGVVIAAGVGFRKDVLLSEHVDCANAHNVPYNTFHIPDPLKNMTEQAQWYSEQYGVANAKPWFDNERPYIGSREPTKSEADEYQYALDNYHPLEPGEYSRWEILIRQGLSPRLKKHKLWIAHYLWDLDRLSEDVKTYQRYEPFFEQRALDYPPNTLDEYLDSVIAWQITHTGDARYYCANEITKDPVYMYGMTNADLNVSTIPACEFMLMFWQDEQEPPPPDDPEEPCKCCDVLKKIYELAKRYI